METTSVEHPVYTGGRVSQFFRVHVASPVWGTAQAFNRWLGTLPSTNFQVLVSALLAMTTAMVYYVTILQEITVESVNFGMWLGFVAAYGGIAYKQFSKKRDSTKPELMTRQNGIDTK